MIVALLILKILAVWLTFAFVGGIIVGNVLKGRQP